MAYIPKPFKRPGVEIGSRTKRRWMDTVVGSLSVGDVVRDRGQVVAVSPRTIFTQVDYLSGEFDYFVDTDIIRAFTEGDSVGDGE